MSNRFLSVIRGIAPLLSLIVFVLPANAASFDCAKAATKVEKLICGDDELSGLDDQVGITYQQDINKSNKDQKDLLSSGQKNWLEQSRNICTDKSCLTKSYSSRIDALTNFMGAIISAQGGDWIFHYGGGKDEPYCHTLLRRLNRYDRHESFTNRCSWNAIASFPEFSDPPWEDLDPKQYEDLIFKLEKYSQEGPDGYFHRLTGLIEFPDSVYRNWTKDFIANKGRLQVWRTELSSFNSASFQRADHPFTEQTIVRMSGGFPTAPPNKGQGKVCPGMPNPTWQHGAVVYVTADLSGPDPAVDMGTFGVMTGKDLTIYQGKPIFVGLTSIWRDSPNGLVSSCDFEFVQRKK